MILVTGGTGFLGTQLVHQLLAQNQSVRLLCRDPQKASHFDSQKVQIVQGDLCEPRAVVEAVHGVEQVYHIAGRVDFNPPDNRELLAVNEQGTRNVLQAARDAQVQKIVHVSSVSTIGAAKRFEEPLSEEDFGKGIGTNLPYPSSKYRGECVALEFANQGLPVVIVNPTFFAGPEDWNLSSARTILSFLRGQVWVGLDRGGMGLTDVRDIAKGMILAMQKGKPGRRYILGGHNLRLPEYHALLEKESGVSAPRFRVAPSLAMLLARIGKIAYKAIGVETLVGVGDIRLGQNYWVYDYTRAEDELGLQCRPPEETVRDSIQWLKQAGYLNGTRAK